MFSALISFKRIVLRLCLWLILIFRNTFAHLFISDKIGWLIFALCRWDWLAQWLSFTSLGKGKDTSGNYLLGMFHFCSSFSVSAMILSVRPHVSTCGIYMENLLAFRSGVYSRFKRNFHLYYSKRIVTCHCI